MELNESSPCSKEKCVRHENVMNEENIPKDQNVKDRVSERKRDEREENLK